MVKTDGHGEVTSSMINLAPSPLLQFFAGKGGE